MRVVQGKEEAAGELEGSLDALYLSADTAAADSPENLTFRFELRGKEEVEFKGSLDALSLSADAAATDSSENLTFRAGGGR